MQITAEEKLMYGAMKAIYDSGIPIDFKGAMVLKACLIEAGFHEEIRHTVDIDANWYSDSPPIAEQMTDSLQKALIRAGIDLDVSIYRMYGEGRSAGFELSDRKTGDILFTMDIDVNRPAVKTRIYEISDIRFRGVSVDQMLADKISAVSGDKIFRRIKDVVDLYYLSQVFPFHSADIKQILKDNGRELGAFHAFLHRKNELEHAYDKFRLSGDVNKPPFDGWCERGDKISPTRLCDEVNEYMLGCFRKSNFGSLFGILNTNQSTNQHSYHQQLFYKTGNSVVQKLST